MQFCAIVFLSLFGVGLLHASADDDVSTLKPSEKLEMNDRINELPPHHHIPAGQPDKKTWIFDNILSIDECQGLIDYITSLHIHREYLHKDFDPSHGMETFDATVTPWIAVLNKTEVMSFIAWEKAKSVLEATFGENVHMEHVHGEFTRSLDPKQIVEGSGCDANRYIATIFLTTSWRHNDYGQISFYSRVANSNVSSEKRLESIETVHPKPGRMVVWSSRLAHFFHPPSVNYRENLLTVNIWLTSSNVPEQTANPPFEKYSVKGPRESMAVSEFVFTNADAERSIDYEKHLKRTFRDSSNRGIFVFDDLYTTEELSHLKDLLINVGTTYANEYDAGSLEDSDNVQWIKAFNVSQFLQTPIWKRVHELASFVSGEDGWYPYDIALNYVRSSDHTRIHPDASPHEHEYTYLLYLTDGIGLDELGETVWFEERRKGHDGIHKFTGQGGEEFEPIAAVRPKYGRVVIFRNVIEHSARPPSSQFFGCRYSFAVKVSRTERTALIKQVYEVMEAFDSEDMDEKMEDLSVKLQQGSHDDENHSSLTIESLRKMLEDFQARAISRRENLHMKLLGELQGRSNQ